MVALTTAGIIWACAVSAAAAAPGPLAHASVVGGHPASIAEFPSAAYIAGGRGREATFCTGAVVAPRVVLTAGHCVENIDSLEQFRIADFHVTTGVADVRHPPSASVSRVTAALAYPGFDPSNLLGDAGLLVLARPVAAPPISLASPASPAPLETGTPLAIPGWGFTDPDGNPPKVLQTGEIAAQSTLYCRRHSKNIVAHYSTSLQICGVDLPDEEVANCYGDSGGPAVARRPDGTQVEVGIVSTGGAFCGPGEVNIFTRVEAIADWVQAWIATVEAGAPPPLEPKARLSRMTLSMATYLSGFTFSEVLGNRSVFLEPLQDSCHRLGPSSVRCEKTWQLKRTLLRVSVTSSWAIQHNQVVLRGSYVVHTVGRRCIAGPHPKSCPVHTLRG